MERENKQLQAQWDHEAAMRGASDSVRYKLHISVDDFKLAYMAERAKRIAEFGEEVGGVVRK